MDYFEVPEANPGSDGLCSDNDCPCGYPGARIPRGTGYIYVSQAEVDFRKDARTVREAETKIAMMRAMSKNNVLMFDQNVVTSTLMCEQGARKRGLDLEVAAADARYWWKTGLVPLRATPLAGSGASKAATPPADPEKQTTHASNSSWIRYGCAAVGVILALLVLGKSGGFIGGAIGAGIGYGVGLLIEKMVNRK
jgi:hypothetical protein